VLGFNDGNIFIAATGLFLTIFAAVWSLAWWLSNQFAVTRAIVYDQVEKLTNLFTSKLEYHEKHDDQRFSAISNDLWDIKVRAAALKGIYLTTDEAQLTPVSKKIKKILKEEN
jgi:hypothetical protein